jgi:hypothetical protein
MRSESVLVLAVMVLLAGLSGPVSAQKYSGGTGEPNSPYRIETAEDLNDIGNHVEDFNKCFIMVNDINMIEYSGTEFNIIGPNATTPFVGVFDGNHKQISNFTYSAAGTNYIGIFGIVEEESAAIKNSNLIDPNVDAGTRDYIGTLVGRLGENALVSNCSVENGNVIGDDYVGLLVGNCYKGTITNCYSVGVVSGEDWVGGLVGRLFGGTVSDCYSLSNVSVTGTYGSGGLIGNIINGTVERCYSDSTASGEFFVGGLVGDNSSGTIRDSYSFGSVSGTGGVGGLLGNNNESGACTRCFSATSVAGSGITTGGLIGYSFGGPITDSFWDVNSSGQTTSGGGTGKTTAEMQKESTFTDAGWDFVGVWNIGENQTYPFLRVHSAGDLNHDDKVNWLDLAILAGHWLEGTE